MKNNIRLSVFFAVVAVLVAGVGIESPAPNESPAPVEARTSWSAAFPVAQAEFAAHPTAPTD